MTDETKNNECIKLDGNSFVVVVSALIYALNKQMQAVSCIDDAEILRDELMKRGYFG